METEGNTLAISPTRKKSDSNISKNLNDKHRKTSQFTSLQNADYEKPSWSKMAKSAFKESAEMTTGHGLPHLIRCTRWYQRVIWVISIFLSIALCLFMVSKAILQYLDFDVTTKIRVESNAELVFPVVSFCGLNPWLSGKSYYYLKAY